MYHRVIRPLLFRLPAEVAHHLVLLLLRSGGRLPGFRWLLNKSFSVHHPSLKKTIAGMHFVNPVGLAAGFDKDGKAFREFGAFGFGFVEVGTVTPKPQPGNDKPRLFRLKDDRALINRMGFNNEGVYALSRRLRKPHRNLIIGGNIGKNRHTSNDHAVKDYLDCFNELYPVVDYFVLNISSPNTPGLRDLQEKGPLVELLNAIEEMNHRTGASKPVFLKIAPDLTYEQVDDIIEIVSLTGIDGLVVSNTTISRENLVAPRQSVEKIGSGGLSGQPLFEKSTLLLKYIADKSQKKFALIASGGIMSPEQAVEKLEAGADLIQVYTGFIYEGPGIVKQILKKLIKN